MASENAPLLSWYTATAAQIRKDFIVHGIEIHFPDNCGEGPDKTISDQLLPVILHLLNTERRKLLQIIYRIDLPESQLGSAIADLNIDEASVQITRLIIEREKQKVELRRKFR